ncbi:hypothetical protein MGG_17125, partial [Pyricularia oryzae 70-15]
NGCDSPRISNRRGGGGYRYASFAAYQRGKAVRVTGGSRVLVAADRYRNYAMISGCLSVVSDFYGHRPAIMIHRRIS